jgi:GTP pyrophosphokinase
MLRALAAAAQIHATQKRKGTDIPYLSHLLGTCSIALDYGANENEAIAALLHDVIEDGVPTEAAKKAVASFGRKVSRIVEGCTESDTHPKPPWRERKQAYLLRIATGGNSVLLVSASDKLHNARSIVRDLRTDGEEVWDRFNAPKDDILWYYGSLVKAYRANPEANRALVGELARTVAAMKTMARRTA